MNNSDDFNNFIDSLIDKNTIQNDYAKDINKRINNGNNSLISSSNNNKVKLLASKIVAVNTANKSFIDLKPYFARSPKAKRTKDGGWYMVIPVGNHKAADLRSIYGRSSWDKISHLDFGSTSDGSLSGSDFQSKVQGQQNILSPLNYTWKSANVTRVMRGTSGTRGSYNTFRTVSSKSDPMSWIVGRQSISNDAQQEGQNNSVSATDIAEAIKQIIDQT